MDEVTGPVIAIALVLCAVFVPTAFMAGISGEFFRQFALTIAASTIISAFNSLTLSPALCAILLQGARQRRTGPTSTATAKKEALPRLGIVLIAGLLGLLLARTASSRTSRACELPGGHGAAGDRQVTRARGTAGRHGWSAVAAGAVAGWFLAGLVNRALGAFFAAFNWVFDRAINGYGRTVAVAAASLRHRAAGLRRTDGPDLPRLPGRARRLHPRPGQGIPGRQRAVARRRQPGPHRQDRQADERDRSRCREGPGSLAHDRPCPATPRCSSTNISNVGGMFVILEPFEERKGDPERSAPAIAAKLREQYRDIRGAQIAVFGAPPIDGLGTTGGFKLQVQDRRGGRSPRPARGRAEPGRPRQRRSAARRTVQQLHGRTSPNSSSRSTATSSSPRRCRSTT